MRPSLALLLLLACDSTPAPAPTPAAAPVAAAIVDELQEARKKTAALEAMQLHQASELFMVSKRGACPKDVAELVGSGMLATAKKDPWDGEYEIVCDPDGRVAVVSAGPDRTQKTDDDIVHRTK